jgi:pilus assembly protein Flp/PilA
VILRNGAQGLESSGFFILATNVARPRCSVPQHFLFRFVPPAAAEGRYTMKLRDWFELVRIQLHREEGQTMAEYGLLIALVAIVVIGAITLLGNNLTDAFNNIAGSL